MSRRGIGTVLSSQAFKLRVGGKVMGEIDPDQSLYQTTAHWYTPTRGASPVLVLGEGEFDAILRSNVQRIEYISPASSRYWSALIGDHHTLRTPNGMRWVVKQDACVERIA